MMRFLAFGFLFFFFQHLLTAQECTPDPGPAIFFEDFGSGFGQGLALASGTTTYNFGSINDGSYVISNVTGINGGFWHEGFDHTEGDTGGYMFLVNATEGAGIFYQKTLMDLCEHTDYLFSCYIANVVVPIGCIGDAEKPDIRFSVVDPGNGTTLATMTTGEIFYSSFLTWRPYTLKFRTGPNQTTLLLQLINNAPGGCGNDLAIDDISLRLCNVQLEQSFDLCDLPDGSLSVGTSTYTQAGVYLDALPVPNSCNDTLITTTLTGDTRLLPTISYTFCEGETLEIDGRQFTASTSFVDTLVGTTDNCPQYQPYVITAQPLQTINQEVALCSGESLQVGANWYTEAGIYMDALTTSAGCDSVVVTTISTSNIEVEVMPNVVDVPFGEWVQLMSIVSSSNDYNLSWQPAGAFSCTDCSSPLFQPVNSGVYQLIATDNLTGCTDSARIQVTVQTCEKVYVPNAFSPNFDNMNDSFELFAEECFTRLLSWRVFDRWGGLVYEAAEQDLNNRFIGWDGLIEGQPAAQGIYSYQLLLERNNGTRKKISGEVVLLY
ncbi:gliding motility-associated C-terminal domain-containing protein [Lewinella sp. LCG006]|uniref:T9SS type B sorting domain-containing protein n=1 Tax=Lewinella sp. LCG006 TaxID=3231911 RepID=UPI00345FA8E3